MRTSNQSVGMRCGGVVKNGVALSALAVVLAAGQPRAMGTLVAWNNAAGGAASVSANWAPVQVPLATDDATFSLAASYAVTFNSSVPTTRTQTYGATSGTVTLTCSSPHTVTNGITIGAASPQNAIMTLTTGTLTSNAGVVIGSASGSTGRLNVNDQDADLILTTAAGDLTVGSNGAGTLSITGGGLVDVADRFIAGSNSTSASTVTVSGFTAVPATDSTLLCRGTSVAAAIGAGGDTTFTVSNGALAHFFGTLNIAQGLVSTSSATVGGLGLLKARLQVDGDLNIAGNQSAGSAAGNGTLTINADGDVAVAGATNVGNDPDGGTGTLTMNSGATLTTHDLIVNDTNGTLNFLGGSISVNGGVLDPRGTTLSLAGSVPTTNLTLFGGATSTLAENGATPSLTVGATSQANCFVQSPGTLLTCNGSVVIGQNAASTGALIVDVGATANITGALRLGSLGRGEVIVGGGASLTTGNVFIGEGGSANGSLRVLHGGATFNANGFVAVGGGFAPGGTGLLDVEDGGHAHTIGNLTVWTPGGTLNVDNATLDVDGTITASGPVTMTQGVINTTALNLNNTTFSGSGVVNGEVRINSGISSITATGPLTLGLSTSANGFANSGTLAIGAQTVTLLDGNGASLNTATIAGGRLITPNGAFIASSFNLSGFGVIQSALTNFGAITSTGAGLTFNGLVTGIGQGISGTATHWLSGGSFIGTGTIATSIDADAASSFTASGGPLTIGNAFSNFGVVTTGQLHSGPNNLTLLDFNGIGLGSLTDMDNGILTCAQQLVVSPGSRIAGRGAIHAPLLFLNSGGILSPGNIPASNTGHLSTTGQLRFFSGSTFECQLGGTGAGQFDDIDVSLLATLDGALNVTLVNGFTPTTGNQFTILTARSGMTGTFATTSLPTGFSVRYNPSNVVVIFCPADFDHNGTLGVNDIFVFLAAWFAGDPNANFNHTGATDVQDIFDFLSAWFAGC